MDVDPFHLAGKLSRFVAGRRPADITWVINQHALRGGLRRIVVDVEFPAVHDSDHRPLHAGQNRNRAAASIRRATGAAATGGRNRADNRSDSDRYCIGLAATLVIHPAGAHYDTTALDDSALAVGRGLLFITAGGRMALHAAPEVLWDSPVGGKMGTSAPAALRSTAGAASCASFGICFGQGPDGHRVVASSHSAARRRIDRTDAAATGGDHCSRTGAHTPPRLSDQSAAGGGRNLALLPPRGLVGLSTDSSGAGTLL